MQTPFPPFAALALHKGNSQNLQLVGVGDDGALSLAAWQSHATGTWAVPDTNALAFQKGTFTAGALASGNGDRLQVLGLGADQQIYLAAWQHEDGTWLAPIPANAGPMGDPARRYTALAAHRGGNGSLQVLGLGTDGQICVVVTQDENGVWHADGHILGTSGMSYASIVPATDAEGRLQLLGLGTDGQAYWVAAQDNGGWHLRDAVVGNPKHRYTALAAARSNGGNLQVMGLGTDRKIYLVAWQDKKQAWHVRGQNDGRVGKNDRPYATVAAYIGADRNLQVVCLGTDGKAYLAAYEDKDGAWHAPSSKSNGPLGNPELVYQALVVASGPGSDAKHPGELDVIGLGAGFDDGLPYLVARQDSKGRWHAGQPLFSGRSSPMAGNWQASLPGGVWLNGCLAYDTVWVVTNDKAVRGFDHFTGAETHVFATFGDGVSPRDVKPFQDGLLVYCSDNRLYFVDFGTEAPPQPIARTDDQLIWMQAQGGSVFGCCSRTGVVRVPPKAEGVPPSRDGQIVIGAYGAGYTVGWPSIGPDRVLAAIDDGPRLCALNPVDLSLIASCALPKMPSWSGSACNGSVVCLALDDGKTVCAVPTSLDKVAWSMTFASPVSYQLACDAGYCYVPLADGSVKILNIADGTSAAGKPEIKLAGALNALLLDGGVLYGASAAGAFVAAIDIATGQVLTLPTSGSPTLIGADSGVLYFGDQKTVRAMRLAGLFRRFYAEATLMQDVDVPAPGLGAPVKAPAIQTEITLYDKTGGPYAQQQVRIGATGPVKIRCNGVDHAIGTADAPFATLPTDVCGRVRISLRPANLTTPSLALFTTFMDGDLSLLVRPDAQLHDKLANIKGADLKAAKGYDGKPVVKAEYRDDADALANAAGMMNASIGMVKASLDGRQTLLAATLSHRQMRYLARGCDMETICCCPQGDYTCRPVCDRNFAFDLAAGSGGFGYRDQAATRAWLAAHPLSVTAPPARPGSPEGWWDDFWEDVKDGAAAVTDAIIYVADEVADQVKTVVSWIRQGAKYTYEFVVDTIEKAVTLVEGIFNTIVGAVGKVLEALSFLFDFDHVIKLQGQMRSGAETAWKRLLGTDGQGPGLLFRARDDVAGKLQQWKAQINQVFQQAKVEVGDFSAAQAQARTSGPSNPAEGGSTSRWFESRIGEGLVSPPAMRAALVAGDGQGVGTGPRGIPDVQIPADILSDVGRLVSQIAQDPKITSDGQRALQEIQATLYSDDAGSGLFARTLSVILSAIELAVDVVIDVAEDIWRALIDILAKILDCAWAYITQPMDIPVISDLYGYATGTDGSKMTILDLVCLAAAVPASLLIPRRSARREANASKSLVKEAAILAGCAQILSAGLRGLVTAVTVGTKADTWLSGPQKKWFGALRAFIFLGFGAVARAAAAWSYIEATKGNDDAVMSNTVLWTLGFFALAADIFVVWPNKDQDLPIMGILFGAFIGCGGLFLTCIYMLEDQLGNWYGFGAYLAAFCGLCVRVLRLATRGITPQQIAGSLAVTAVVTGLQVGSGVVKIVGATV